jgi:hypothetical protein
MRRKLRWISIGFAFIAALGLSQGTTSAADKTKVDHATAHVQRGAKQIGRGEVGPGFKHMFVGIGHTFVEGAKFSGQNIKEFFTGKK